MGYFGIQNNYKSEIHEKPLTRKTPGIPGKKQDKESLSVSVYKRETGRLFSFPVP
ncbi:MAG: hypothetical protein GXO89_16235 [Chlorobi bacterium]|nr:hypothetical protein [Chlorobiota bacterium]